MIHIQFISSYRGQADYMVYDGKEEYRISWHFATPNYDGTWNLSPEEFKRDIEGALNLVHRAFSKEPLKKEVFDACMKAIKKARPEQASLTKSAIWNEGWQVVEF